MIIYNLLNEGMKERLEDICYKSIKDTWGYGYGDVPEEINNRLQAELNTIDKMKQSSYFVLIHDMIVDLGLTSKDYAVFRGTCGNLLVSYLCGFTDYNPMEFNLSPYIAYSYEGNRLIDIDISITDISRQRAISWLENNDLLEGVPEIKQSGGRVFLVPKGVEYKNMLMVLPNAKNGRECVCDEKDEIRGLFQELSLLGAGSALSFGKNIETHSIYKICNPKTFDEMVTVYGLISGHNIWSLMEPLLSSGEITLNDVIAFRDDIYDYLINHGLSEKVSSDIADFSGRRGYAIKPQSEVWINMKSTMKKANVPEWFITCCEENEYLFPKAHAIGRLKCQMRSL